MGCLKRHLKLPTVTILCYTSNSFLSFPAILFFIILVGSLKQTSNFPPQRLLLHSNSILPSRPLLSRTFHKLKNNLTRDRSRQARILGFRGPTETEKGQPRGLLPWGGGTPAGAVTRQPKVSVRRWKARPYVGRIRYHGTPWANSGRLVNYLFSVCPLSAAD